MTSATTTTSTITSLKAASVLVVEDQNFVRDLLGRLLTSLSVANALTARSAEDALATLERDPGAVQALIVDFELPGMNGVRFIETLRASPHPELRDLPIIMLTGHNDLALCREAARFGIAAFLVKPAGPATLKAALEGALAGQRIAVPREDIAKI